MLNNLNLQPNFVTHDRTSYEFKPQNKEEEPKCVQLWLNSVDKISGTNNNATFRVNLPTEFLSDRLRVTLKNFIPVYPTGTNEGILRINMVGIDNPYSYSSSNQNTHRTLETIRLNDGLVKEYPPAAMTANTTTFSNLSYGNGTYVASGPNRDAPFQMFDKNNNTTANYFSGGYGGFPTASNGDYYQSAFTTMSGSNYYGLPFTLTTPSNIIPTYYTIQTHGDNCKSVTQWVMGGSSNAGSTWALLDYYPQSNVGAWSLITRPLYTSNAYNVYRIVALTVGRTTCGTSFRDIPTIPEWRMYGTPVQPQVLYTNSNNPNSIVTDRIGQVNLNNEIITTDKTLFDRPITLQLTSPTGLDLSTMSNWSAQISVVEEKSADIV